MSQSRAAEQNEDFGLPPPPPPPPRSSHGGSSAAHSRSPRNSRSRSASPISKDAEEFRRRDSSRSPRRRRDSRTRSSRSPRSRSTLSSRSYSDTSYTSSRSYTSYTSRTYTDSRASRSVSQHRAKSPPRRGGSLRREVVDPSRMPMVPVPGTYGGYSHIPPPPPPQANFYAPPPMEEPEPVPIDNQLEDVVKLAVRENENVLERNARRHRFGLSDMYPVCASSDNTANAAPVNSAILHRICVELSVPLIYQNSTTNSAAPASGQLSKKDLLRGRGGARGAAALQDNAELRLAITEGVRFVRYHLALGYSEELAKGLIWRVVEAQGQQDRLGAWMLLDEVLHAVSEIADCGTNGADPFAHDGRPSDSNTVRRSGLIDGEVSDQAQQSALMKNVTAQRTASKFMHRMREYLPYLILFCWEGGPLSLAARHPRVLGYSPSVSSLVKDTHDAANNSSTLTPNASIVAAAELNRINHTVKDFLYGYSNGDGTLTEVGSKKSRQEGTGGMSGPNSTGGYRTLGTQGGPMTAASQGGEIKLSDTVRFAIAKQLAEAYDGVLSGWESLFGAFFNTHLIKAVCDNLIVVCSGNTATAAIVTQDHKDKYLKFFLPPTNAFLDSIWKLRRKEPRPSLAEFLLVTYGWPHHRLSAYSDADAAQRLKLEEEFGELLPAIPFVTHLPVDVADLKKAGCAPMNSKAQSWVRRLIEKRGGCTMCDTWDHTSAQCPNRSEVVYLKNTERLSARMSGEKARAELERAGFVLETITESPAVRHLLTQEERDATRHAGSSGAVALGDSFNFASSAPVMERRMRLLTAAVLDKASELIVLSVDHTPLLDALDVVLGQRSSAAERHAIVSVATYHLSPSRVLRIMPGSTTHRATEREFCTESGMSTLVLLHRSNRFREAEKLEKALETLFYRYCPSKYVPTTRPSADVVTALSDTFIIQKLRTYLFAWWERPLEECIIKGLDFDTPFPPRNNTSNIKVTHSTAPSLRVVHNDTFDQLRAVGADTTNPYAAVLLTALRRLRRVSSLICRVSLDIVPLGSHIPLISPFPALDFNSRNTFGERTMYAGGQTLATNLSIMRWDWFIAKNVVMTGYKIQDGNKPGEERREPAGGGGGGGRKRPKEQFDEFTDLIGREAYNQEQNGDVTGYYKLTILKTHIEARDYCFFCHKIGHSIKQCGQLLSIVVDKHKKDWKINTITEARLSFNRLALRLNGLRNECVPVMRRALDANEVTKIQATNEIGPLRAKLEAAIESKSTLEKMRDANTLAGIEITAELGRNLANAASVVEQLETELSNLAGDIERFVRLDETLNNDIRNTLRECNQIEDLVNVMSPTGHRFLPNVGIKKGIRVDIFASTPNAFRGFPAAYKTSLDSLAQVGIPMKRLRYSGAQCISMLQKIEANDLVQQVQPVTEAAFPDVDFVSGKFLDDIFGQREAALRNGDQKAKHDRPGILAHFTYELHDREIDSFFKPDRPIETSAFMFDLQQASQERVCEFAVYIKTLYGGIENVYSVLTPLSPHARIVSSDLAARGAPLWRDCISRMNFQGPTDRNAIKQRLRSEAQFYRSLPNAEAKMAYVFFSLTQVRANLRKSTERMSSEWEGMMNSILSSQQQLSPEAITGKLTVLPGRMPSDVVFTFGPAEATVPQYAVGGLVSEFGRKFSVQENLLKMAKSRSMAHIRAPRVETSSSTQLQQSSSSSMLLDGGGGGGSPRSSHSRTAIYRAGSLDLFARPSSLMMAAAPTTTTTSGTQLMYTQEDGTADDGFGESSTPHNYGLDPLMVLGEKRPRQEEEVATQ